MYSIVTYEVTGFGVAFAPLKQTTTNTLAPYAYTIDTNRYRHPP